MYYNLFKQALAFCASFPVLWHSGFSLGTLQYSALIICFAWVKGGCTNTKDILACLYNAIVSGSVVLVDNSFVEERDVISQRPSET